MKKLMILVLMMTVSIGVNAKVLLEKRVFGGFRALPLKSVSYVINDDRSVKQVIKTEESGEVEVKNIGWVHPVIMKEIIDLIVKVESESAEFTPVPKTYDGILCDASSFKIDIVRENGEKLNIASGYAGEYLSVMNSRAAIMLSLYMDQYVSNPIGLFQLSKLL